MQKSKFTSVPLLLILYRFVLGPVLLGVASTGPHPILFFAILTTGVLSDIFDGILARQMGIATVRLRTLDSRADLVFWHCTAIALYLVQPDFVRAHLMPFMAVVGTYALTYVVSYAKFGRAPSVHAILSKFFALSMFVGFTALLCFGVGGFCYSLMVTLGIAANLEVILILLLLPKWQHDIPSCYHAFQIRRGREIQRWKVFN